MKLAKALICLAFILFTVGLAHTGQIDSRLRELLISEHNRNRFYSVIVVMADQADIESLDRLLINNKATLNDRHSQVITALQEIAYQTQPPVLSYMRYLESAGDIRFTKHFWIANMIAFEGKASAIWAIAALNSVGKVYLDVPVSTIWPNVEGKPSPSGRLIAGHEPGLSRIHAPEAWALGYTGYGRVVANLDTGVDGFHPALMYRFRGDVNGDGNNNESWFDPYTTHWTYPTDSGTHGTHTMGTICGRTNTGDTIGVAIDAKWIAAACIDRGGGLSRTVSDALLAIQWIADPDGNPATADNPDACGNSWGIPDDNGYDDCDQTFWIAIDNCEAAGTVMVFAAGNEGTAGLRSPADRATTYHNCFSVGAIDGYNPNLEIASFSARGPSECARGDLAIKPEVVAPGVNVRSSIRGGGYQVFSGTSMACPHVAGAVAIIRQANPNLDATAIKQILIQTADDLGQADDDNTYGNGIINIYAAVMAATTYGSVAGYVRDASTALPIPAKLKIIGARIQVFADNSGYYYLGLKSDTTYTIEASYYGYLATQQSAFIGINDTIPLDFNLVAAQPAIVQGNVRSGTGDAVEGAEVKLINTPLPPETTDASGFYRFEEVPSGALYYIEIRATDYNKGFDSLLVQSGIINQHDIEIWPVESFEQLSGGFVGGNVWQWGNPTYGPDSAHSGTKCWGTILSGSYPNLVQDTLKSHTVFVESQTAVIQFYHWYQFEDYYDGGNLIISTNSGLTWNLLYPSGGYTNNDIVGLNHQPGYSHISNGWEMVSANLGVYYHNNITIGWRMGSDASVVKAGWYIDDVSFIGCIPPPPPQLEYYPLSFTEIINPGTIETRELYLNNPGLGPLNYQLSGIPLNLRPNRNGSNQQLLGYIRNDTHKPEPDSAPYYTPVSCSHGGPDAFGYLWKDSDEPRGPRYNWVDIANIGTSLSLGDDDYAGPINLNFDFPFYDSIYSSIYVGSNGIISFGRGSSSTNNTALPNDALPNNLIAIWWDDLNPASGGKVYYYSDLENNRFIVSFIEIPNYQYYYGTGSLTFQAILYPTGKITLQYQFMDPGSDPDSLHGATIGIENILGDDGLQVAYNANYVHNEHAIVLSRNWLNVGPKNGVILPGGSDTAAIVFDANYLDGYLYSGNINIQSNDSSNPSVNIPVTLSTGPGGNPIIDFSGNRLVDSLSVDSIGTIYLKVFNRGTGILAAEFGTYGTWIQFNGGPYYIAPSDSVAIPIHINSAGFLPGIYNGIINYISNDPLMPEGNLEVELVVLAPNILLSIEYLSDTLNINQRSSKTFIISNDGAGKLNYFIGFTQQSGPPKFLPDGIGNKQIPQYPIFLSDKAFSGDGQKEFNFLTLSGGGPDNIGYRWVDSNEPGGPVFNWIDISDIGIPIAVNYDDQNIGPFSLGFVFPYYRYDYESIRFCSNGWLSFTSTSTAYNNTSLPNLAAPSNILAVFWDDLIFYSNSRAYFYTNQQDSAIITWQNAFHVGGGGPYTFQAILTKSGYITFQYLNIGTPDSLATIGIQNNDKSCGLMAAFNTKYASANMAIVFWPGWLSVSPLFGTVAPLSRDTISVALNSYMLGAMTYSGQLTVQSNDPLSSELVIPVSLNVQPEPFASIALSDSVFWDTLVIGSSASKLLFINNIGTAILDYRFIPEDEWITAYPSNGTIIPDRAETIAVIISALNLEPGNYIGQLVLSSNDPIHATILITFNVLVTFSNCVFIPGDINGDNQLLGSDIIYGVRYFKGIGDAPPDSCIDDSLQQWLYISGDVNGNCEFRGSDITYLVAYFKQGYPALLICPRISQGLPSPKGQYHPDLSGRLSR
jgi:subtilisin family serine protease